MTLEHELPAKLNAVHEFENPHIKAARLFIDDDESTLELARLALPVLGSVVHPTWTSAFLHCLFLVTNLLAPRTFAETTKFVHLTG